MKALRTLFVSAAAIGLMAIGSAAQAQDKTIKIGALFPMSGPGSYFGAQDKQGVELALAGTTADNEVIGHDRDGANIEQDDIPGLLLLDQLDDAFRQVQRFQ